jgi:hypothetical protein
MSRNVEETNTRIVRVFAERATDSTGSAMGAALTDPPGVVQL